MSTGSLTLDLGGLRDYKRRLVHAAEEDANPFERLKAQTENVPGRFVAVAVCNMLEFRYGMDPADMLNADFVPGSFATLREAFRALLFFIFTEVDEVRKHAALRRAAGEYNPAFSHCDAHDPLPPLDEVLPPDDTEMEWYDRFDEWAYAYVWTGVIRFTPD